MYKRIAEIFLMTVLACFMVMLCNGCGEAHNLEEIVAVEATCEQAGTIAHWHCVDCGDNFLDENADTPIESVVIPALGHDYSDLMTIRSTRTERGEAFSICRRCGKEERTELAPGEHLFRSYDTVAPTCDRAGKREFVCVNCGTIESEILPATGLHDLEQVVGINATCDNPGILVHWHCSDCGANFVDAAASARMKTVELPALGHDLSEPENDRTDCGEWAEELRVCRRCGEEMRTKLPPREHSFQIYETAPTCIDSGKRVRACEYCSLMEIELLPATGVHVFNFENVCKLCSQRCMETADLKYELVIDDGMAVGYAVTGCSSSGSIVIPYYHDKIPVIEIGAAAFLNNSGITSLSNYAPLRAIRDRAFEGCSKLPVITFPETLVSIGVDAFRSCTSLSSIFIPDSVKNIEKFAFYACSKVQHLEIGAGVEVIGEHAFYGCEKLSEIVVDENNNAFLGEGNCLVVRSNGRLIAGSSQSRIPDCVKIIGDNAFSGRSGLKTINIPVSVIEIGNFAFRDCVNLVEIVYEGSEEQWKAVKKGVEWNRYTHENLKIKFLK